MTIAVEGRKKVVRVTTGLNLHTYALLSVVDLMSKTESYTALVKQFHPLGLSCPGCGRGCGEAACDGSNRTGFPRYRCKGCGKKYTILSGTIFSGCTLGARRLLLLLLMAGQGREAVEIATAVGLHKNSVKALLLKVARYARRGNS